MPVSTHGFATGKGHRRGPRLLALLAASPAASIGLLAVVLIVCGALLADVLAPHPFARQHPEIAYQGPSRAHLFGTDQLGRDLLSRMLHGSRVSLAVAVMSQIFILAVGVPVGAVAGYAGGRLDQFLMRLVDILLSFPDILLVIVVMTSIRAWLRAPTGGVLSALGEFDAGIGGLLGVLTSLAFLSWLIVARLVRGQVLSIREREFVEAARVLGASHRRVLVRHVLPNCAASIVVAATYWVPRAIMLEAALSFIGLGVQPPLTSWGVMILEGYRSLRSSPHMLLFPALALSVTVMACNFLGDGLRDILDPALRGGRRRSPVQRGGAGPIV